MRVTHCIVGPWPQARSQYQHSDGTAANSTQSLQHNRGIMRIISFNQRYTIQKIDLHLLLRGLTESKVDHAVVFPWGNVHYGVAEMTYVDVFISLIAKNILICQKISPAL